MAPALSSTDADYDVVVIGSGVGGYPDYFASLTVGVRDLFSETWTYGRRQQARTEQMRRCRQDALREISACLR